MYKTHEGLFWIGTQNGLFAFDGANMTTFNTKPENVNWIPSDFIKDIVEIDDLGLLVATFGGGLLVWEPGSRSFRSISRIDSYDISNIYELHPAQDGAVWIATDTDVLLINLHKNESLISRLDDEYLELTGDPSEIVDDQSGNVFIGGRNGLIKWNPDSNLATPVTLSSPLLPHSHSISTLSKGNSDNIIVGTSLGQLFSVDIQTGVELNSASFDQLDSVFISDLQHYNGTILVATDAGLFQSNESFSNLVDLSSQGFSLSNKSIYSLMREDKYVWVGTYDGLDLLSFSSVELVNEKNGGIGNSVAAFAEGRLGTMWIATHEGLYRSNPQTKLHTRIDKLSGATELVDHRATAIKNIKGELWVGFFQGGVQILNDDGTQSSFIYLTDSKHMGIRKILQSEDGEEIWIGTESHGLIRVSEGNVDYFYDSNRLNESSINLLIELDSNRLLIAAVDALYIYNRTTHEFSKLGLSFGSFEQKPPIFSLNITDQGDLLIGTKNYGLFQWALEDQLKDIFHLSQMGEKSSTSHSTINAIEIDSSNNIWCSTDNGIVKFDQSGYLLGRLTLADGLQSNEFDTDVSFQSSDGTLYFGGASGYNKFHPSEIVFDDTPSDTRLTSVTFPDAGTKHLSMGEDNSELLLTHSDYFVTFQFGILDFIDPDAHEFKFQLENFDPNWVNNGNRNTATYTNLPAGEYTFRVQGANSAGIWDTDGDSIKVRVLPPPWLTWWAFCIYAVLALIALWSIHRIYQSYVIDRRAKQLAQEMYEAEERAEDDMQEQVEFQDELIQLAYDHKVFSLNLINDCIGAAGNENQISTNKSIEALTIMEDCLFYQADGPVADLSRYVDIITTRLLPLASVPQETITTINDMPRELVPAEIASPLAVVIYELLENCFKYAFENASPANYIHLQLELHPRSEEAPPMYKFHIQDNGRGIGIQSRAGGSNAISGLNVATKVAARFNCELQINSDDGTRIGMNIPFPG